MRVFKAKVFEKFARKKGINDKKLADAVEEIERGLYEADLGGGLIKKRVAREGGGKSGGYRTIIVYRKADLSVFVYGFPKNVKDNLDDDELHEYKKLARILLKLNDTDITKALDSGELEEVSYDEKKIQE